jgi:protein TonB
MLETALLSTRSPARAHAVRVSLPAIVALHGAAVLVFAGASVWNDGEPPEPDVPIVFARFASPPPPPGGAPQTTAPPHTAGPKTSASFPIRIELIPDPASVHETEEAEETGISDSIGGDRFSGSGSQDGVPGGIDDGGPIAGEGSGDEPLIPGGAVSYPVLVHRVEPDYPRAAIATRSEGVVILEAIITASGGVEEVSVLKSANPLLDEAAVRAVRQWTYRPATLNGRAVRVRLTVTVTFSIPAGNT